MLLNLDSNLNSAAWPKTLKAVPEGNPRFRGQNLWPSSWVWFPALLGLVWGASTNTGCYRVCGSGCWPLFEEFWAICLCKQSSPRLLMIVNNHLLSYWFCSILQSFIGFWVKIWHRNKTAGSNPVQSSRSNLTTCRRKGRLLRFKLNSTVTSDGSEQKIGKKSQV